MRGALTGPLSLRFGNGPDKAPRTAPIRRRTQRPEPPRRFTPSPPPPTATSFRLPIRFRALIASGHHHHSSDRSRTSRITSITAGSHPRSIRNVYAAAHSFVSFTHRPNHRRRF